MNEQGRDELVEQVMEAANTVALRRQQLNHALREFEDAVGEHAGLMGALQCREIS